MHFNDKQSPNSSFSSEKSIEEFKPVFLNRPEIEKSMQLEEKFQILEKNINFFMDNLLVSTNSRKQEEEMVKKKQAEIDYFLNILHLIKKECEVNQQKQDEINSGFLKNYAWKLGKLENEMKQIETTTQKKTIKPLKQSTFHIFSIQPISNQTKKIQTKSKENYLKAESKNMKKERKKIIMSTNNNKLL